MANRAAAPLTSRTEAMPAKGAADENFPVASVLIAPRLRRHVMRFYAFARAADDIADNPALTPAEKLRQLDRFEAALTTHAALPLEAAQLRESLAATGVSDRHARALLAAFRQDATKQRYRDWDELMAYCALSAHPVGRFMLDLHGEAPAAATPGDALCAALQVLNHLQDCGQDRHLLDRIYLPGDWMSEAGAEPEDLDADAASPALRRVLDRCLDATDRLLDAAAPLAGMLRSRRLGAEVAVIHCLASRLASRLRRQDPLAGRVALGRGDMAAAALAGLWRLVCR
ncbi:MAG TPA: squalene synthase HpnC [Thermohalobaculum sp.]|nr:squalene synthase HpnC [Thermohalobaculum sp.]